jgi:DNA-binding IclR family transcriptional regulator
MTTEVAVALANDRPDARHAPNGPHAPPEEGRSSALLRGLAIVSALVERGSLRVEELAQAVDMPLSSVYRYVRTMREAGYLDEVAGAYSVGRRLAVSGRSTGAQHLVRLAEPHLVRLRERTDETAILTVRVQTTALCLDRVTPRRRLPLSFQRGGTRPLYAGAGATVLLAYAPDAVLRQVLAAPMPATTARTPTPATLPGVLAAIREQGFAFSHAELDPQMISVAAPVFRGTVCVCGLSIAGTERSLRRRRRIDRCIEAVREEAAALGSRLTGGATAASWTPQEDS